MKSIVIPYKQSKNNNYYKIQLLARHLNVKSHLEVIILYAIHNTFKNNPLQNNHKTRKNIQLDIIQIIQQDAYFQFVIKKTPTLSAINNAIWKLTKASALIEFDGMLVMYSGFKDIDLVDQIVFRFS